jgi:hypothetical protein
MVPHIRKSFGLRFRIDDLEEWILRGRRKVNITNEILINALTIPSQFNIDNVKGVGEMAKAKLKTRHNCGFGSVYVRKTKKGRPRYYADFRDRNGNRRQKLLKNVTNWQEALEGLKNMVLREHYLECGVDPQKQQIKLKEFVEMFIVNYSKVNKRS